MSVPPAASSPPGRPRRLDASMTLLTEVMQRPLDPGYAAVAEARRAKGEGAAARRRRTAPLTVLLSVVAGAILVIGVMQLRVPRSEDTVGVLREEVTTRTTEVNDRASQVEAVRSEIVVLRDANLDAAGGDLLERVTTLGVLSGAEPVTGPGAVYTLDDADGVSDPLTGDPREGDDTDAGRVLDVDLQVVVNGLWAAGAEAIAVNGHRLTATSAIRSAGPAILVDFRPLAPPYVVEAIGDPATLQPRFARAFAGTYLDSLQQNHDVRVSITGAGELALAGGDALTLRYATPAGPLEDDT